MLKTIEFLKLNIDDRATYLWDNGKYVASREYYNQTINLYSLDGFFVEVWVLENKIDRIELLEEKFYEHYLKNIYVDWLF